MTVFNDSLIVYIGTHAFHNKEPPLTSNKQPRIGLPPTSVRHFGASRVNGRRRDPLPAANSRAVVIGVLIVNSPKNCIVED